MLLTETIKKKLTEFNIKKDFIFEIQTIGGGTQKYDLRQTDPQFYGLVEKLHKYLEDAITWINEDTLEILQNNIINTINQYHSQINSIKNLSTYNEQQFTQQKPSLISSVTQWINQIFNEQDSYKFLNTYYRLKSDFMSNQKNFDEIMSRFKDSTEYLEQQEKLKEKITETLNDEKTDIGLLDYQNYIDILSIQYQRYRKWAIFGFTITIIITLGLLICFSLEGYIHKIKVFGFVMNWIGDGQIKNFSSIPYIFIISSFLLRLSIIGIFVYLSKVFFESYRIFSNKIMMYEGKTQVIKSWKKLLQSGDDEETKKVNKLITEKVLDMLYKDSTGTNYDLGGQNLPASYTEKLFDKVLNFIPGEK